ncbi:type IV secretory system conjugative DNA transfer family protein [Methylocapsa sp. D3K7]|uniref:type IV secretory system conjugative DNA transfer family protein n=1 Tax=Methylocapsa sp. D3K7 TaxID=3041435 RepID=UPI00244E893A|nr:type IV secretory system conjugative DNA transfer family protein [Methylocapsa sp. D3K7]WGJ13267.1 type IV secretory system conjugative DNA transfer family protein [Methylocapsa sp. D3K7]
MIMFTAVCAALYAWLQYQDSFALLLWHLAPREYANEVYKSSPLISGVLLVVLLMWLSRLLQAMRNRGGSDGLWNSRLGRRTVGIVANAVLFVVVFLTACAFATLLPRALPLMTVILPLCVCAAMRPMKIIIGRTTRPLRWFIGGRHVGLGGTARFSGLMDEWANPWQPGQILLGASLYDPKWLVGIEDDRHITTIATSRGGKGRSVIIPNLLTWPGSALVIDPKGQNACVTALKRGQGGDGLVECLNHTVRIVDPLGEIRDPKLLRYIARFNPLAELDPAAPDYSERVDLIADALVVPSSSKDSYFDNSAKSLISGIIDYVMISKNVGYDERNLATVRGLLIHPDGPPLEEMAELGGLAQAGAAGVLQAGKNAAGDVISTAIAHTKWLDSAGMQRTLGASDFSLRDLNNGMTTIYLVLPPQFLDVHTRFLRMFVNLALQSAAEGRKGKYATLFLLDEFYALGRLQQLAKSAGLMAGYGVKLWPIIQNIGQLQELYPQNWETFLGNSGQWMVFAVNDQTTAKYLSERLGRRILWRRMRGPDGYGWEVTGGASLRDPLELSRAISHSSDNVTVFTESGEAFLLGRTPYDKTFKRNRYSADPFEHSRDAIKEAIGDLVWRWKFSFKKPNGGVPHFPALTYNPGQTFMGWWRLRRNKRGR